jgi:release factor glutamine methyltransferase
MAIPSGGKAPVMNSTTQARAPRAESAWCDRDGDPARCTHFEGLEIHYCGEVLEPRPWTAEQSRWATELLEAGDVPRGPVLELCAGAGQIGLAAVATTDRRLVQVDESPIACRWAERNAARSGFGDRVEVRCGDMAATVRPGERYALVLADPPYVPSHQVDDHPDDPRSAIDGGHDGLVLSCRAMQVAIDHTAPGGGVLVQALGAAQLHEIAELVAMRFPGWHLVEVRVVDEHRAVGLWRQVP